MKLIHITKPEFVTSILKNGLKSDSEGFVYLCENILDFDFIAYTELGYNEYSVISVEVDESFLSPDETCETYPDGMYKHHGDILPSKLKLLLPIVHI